MIFCRSVGPLASNEYWAQAEVYGALLCGRRVCQPVEWAGDAPLPYSLKPVIKTVHGVLAGLRNAGVAITQVDVAAHSAGTPLVRLYLQSPYNFGYDALKVGRVRKLISIGGVNGPTPIADFVNQLLASSSPLVVSATRRLFAAAGKNTSNGIINDLSSTGSVATLQPTIVRAHAFIGDLPSLRGTVSEAQSSLTVQFF